MKLEIGGKYRLSYWEKHLFLEVLFLGKSTFLGVDNEGVEIGADINKDWLPYEEPVKEVEWKTFLIEYEIGSIKYRRIEQYTTIEYAHKYNRTALSIKEIKLNFETV